MYKSYIMELFGDIFWPRMPVTKQQLARVMNYRGDDPVTGLNIFDPMSQDQEVLFEVVV